MIIYGHPLLTHPVFAVLLPSRGDQLGSLLSLVLEKNMYRYVTYTNNNNNSGCLVTPILEQIHTGVSYTYKYYIYSIHILYYINK